MYETRQAIIGWALAGTLPPDELPRAMRVAGVTPDGAQWNAFLARLLTWLGAACLAAAAVYFIAANWQALGRYARFALVQGALVVALAVAWWRGLDSLPGRAALFAAAVLMGVLLALVGQVYQTGADTFELFAAWAVAIFVWVAISRQPALWLLWIALVDVAIVLYFRTSAARAVGVTGFLFAPRIALWIVFLSNSAALAAWEWLGAVKGGWLAVRWAPRVLATVAGTVVTLLVAYDVVGLDAREAGWSWAPYALFVGALYYAYRVRTMDLFMLAGMVLSVVVVVSFALGRQALEHGGAGAFLLIGLTLIGCAAAGGYWLRQVGAQTRGSP
jgi:uncharacterized membrane protein